LRPAAPPPDAASREADVPSIEVSFHGSVNRLATLLDIPAATIQSQFAKGSAVPPPRANVSSDVPAEECRGYKQAITLSGQLYETGAGTFLDLLDAQRSLMAEDALVQSEVAIAKT
jgi:hypothetical protein